MKLTTTDSLARSRIMRAVKSTDTMPERVVRRVVSEAGYRYRLHRKDLPGKPDLVFVSLRKVVFVHGCFWHGHRCRRGARMPKTNVDYWREKISKNKLRDRRHVRQLRSIGWQTFVVWECWLANEDSVRLRVANFLGD